MNKYTKEETTLLGDIVAFIICIVIPIIIMYYCITWIEKTFYKKELVCGKIVDKYREPYNNLTYIIYHSKKEDKNVEVHTTIDTYNNYKVGQEICFEYTVLK